MNFGLSLALVLMLLVIWAVHNPLSTLRVLENLRQCVHQILVHHVGKKEFEQVSRRLKVEAFRQKVPQKIADAILDEHRPEMIKRLGEKRLQQDRE